MLASSAESGPRDVSELTHLDNFDCLLATSHFVCLFSCRSFLLRKLSLLLSLTLLRAGPDCAGRFPPRSRTILETS